MFEFYWVLLFMSLEVILSFKQNFVNWEWHKNKNLSKCNTAQRVFFNHKLTSSAENQIFFLYLYFASVIKETGALGWLLVLNPYKNLIDWLLRQEKMLSNSEILLYRKKIHFYVNCCPYLSPILRKTPHTFNALQ